MAIVISIAVILFACCFLVVRFGNENLRRTGIRYRRENRDLYHALEKDGENG